MMFITHTVRATLIAAGLSAVAHAALPAPTALDTSSPQDEVQRFVIRADTQYPRGPDSANQPEESTRLMTEQDNAINQWRNSFGGNIPVFLNGDVTEFGHGPEWSKMFEHLARVPGTYWGLGNHDYENNVDDCANNGCARDSIQHLEAAVAGWQVDSFHIAKEDKPDYLRWTGSFGYSKTIGSITFIQLNNHFNYTKSFSSNGSLIFPRKIHFDITASLDWLEQQMEAATKNGKYIVINLHRPPTDSTFGSEADRNRFYSLVNQYRVLSIFHGHTHYAGKRTAIGDTPVYDAGSSFLRGFLTAELDEGQDSLVVRVATDNDIENAKAYSTPLHLLPPAPTFQFSTQPSGDAIQGLVMYANRPRDTRLPFVQISLNGLPFKRYDSSNNAALLYDLRPNTLYRYTIRIYQAEGQAPAREDKGTFTTPALAKAPTDLCADDIDGDAGTLRLKWKNPSPNFRMPYYIQVEATEPGKPLWVLRSIADDRRSTTETVSYQYHGRDPFAMTYHVFYWSASEGHSGKAQLAGKDIWASGCQYRTD
ncbi:metallophosphoesterase [Pseudomonas monteilii]|uniref:metallophosphoesterase n=1 Tax=Pseudomonas monteilii TaxID=76759 RepID=UPI00383A536B